MAVTFIDNSEQTISAMERAVKAGLTAVGQMASSHARQIITAASRIDTGTMRNSIDFKVQEHTVYVGTNTSYAIYHEMGTGVYIAGGRKSPWAYKDAEGQWHWTRGVRPLHFLKNAVSNFVEEYKAIIRRFLQFG